MSPQIVRNKTLMTSGVTVEDTEMENCLGKAKFTSAEGCMHSMHVFLI
jgi:hypothetical protein